MKKVITILAILVVLVGTVFAQDAQTLTLSTKVAEIIPVFGIEYDANSTSEGTVDGTTVTLDDSIADGPITVSFIVSQNGGSGKTDGAAVSGYSRYGAKTSGSDVTITVTCAQFVGTGDAAGEKSVAPNLSAAYATVVQSNTNKLSFPATNPANVTAAQNATETAINLVPKYYGKKVVDQEIGTVTATWAQKEDLLFGTYTANITLTCTAD